MSEITESLAGPPAVFVAPTLKAAAAAPSPDTPSLMAKTWKLKAGDMWPACDTGSSDSARTAAMTATGLDVAMYDNLPVFVPSRCLVSISEVGGTLVDAAYAEGSGLQLDRQTADEYALNGKPGPAGFRDGISGLDATMDAKFRQQYTWLTRMVTVSQV